MKKKTIKKLEITKEDITILSRDKAKSIVGGNLSDYYYATHCVATLVECNGSPDTTWGCSSTIADTELCNVSSDGSCFSDWGGQFCRT